MPALKPGGAAATTAWRFRSNVPSPITPSDATVVAGRVVIPRRGTGAVVWGPERLKTGAYSSSPVLADGKLYVTSENEGLTTVFAAGPKFQVLAENPLDDYCLASPAVSNGQIFIRTEKFLWAIGAGTTKTAD